MVQTTAYEIKLINTLSTENFTEKFLRLSSSQRWVKEVLKHKPFTTPEALLYTAANVWWNICTRTDWIESFNGRPLIGDMESFKKDLWCAKEDELTLESSQTVADELIACNKPYMDKFGYEWILLCEGLTPQQQLTNYKRRIENDPETELRENCVEDFKVTLRRLRLCLLNQDPYDHLPMQANQSLIGVGVIGAGVIAETFCEAFKKHGGYKVLVVCDTSKKKAETLAKKYHAEAAASYEEVIRRKEISLIYIGVPPKYHCEVFLAAVKAGKNVLCEKPLCLTNDEAETLSIAALDAAKRGIVTAINYPLHYVKALKEFKQLLAEEYVGELRRVELKLHFPHWPRAWQNYQKTDWINRREQGGPLREIGSHFYFAILSLFGGEKAVKRVNAQVHYPEIPSIEGIPTGERVETGALGTFELQNGVPVHLDLLSDLPSIDEKIELTAYGSKGVISLRDFQTLWVSQNKEPLHLYDEKNKISPNQLMSSAFVVDEMSRAICQHAQHPDKWNLASIQLGAQAQRILNALCVSQGRWINVSEDNVRNGDIQHLIAQNLTKPLPIFSHVTNYQGLLHVSCIQGFTPGTFEFPSNSPGPQAEQVIQNLKTVLEESGSGLDRILKLTIFFVDIKNDFSEVNEVIDRYFPNKPPARSSIGVHELPRNAKVVMECTAAVRPN